MNISQFYIRAIMRAKRDLLKSLGIKNDHKFFLDSGMAAQRTDGVYRVGIYSEIVECNYKLPATGEVVKNIHPRRYIYQLDTPTIDPLSGFIYDHKGDLIAESSSWIPSLLFQSWAKPRMKRNKKCIDGQYIFLPNIGYYHWLIEELPVFIAALTRYPYAKILTPKNTSSFAQNFLSSLNQEVIYIDKKTTVKELIMIGKTAGQGNPYLGLTPHPEDIKTLRKYFVKNIKYTENKKVNLYLSREGFRRSPQNEKEIRSLLENNNFISFNAASGLSFLEQISLFSQANHIIGVHGAALANLVWSSQKCSVLELFSSRYMPSCFSNIASIRELNYDFLIYGEKNESTINPTIIKQWISNKNI